MTSVDAGRIYALTISTTSTKCEGKSMPYTSGHTSAATKQYSSTKGAGCVCHTAAPSSSPPTTPSNLKWSKTRGSYRVPTKSARQMRRRPDTSPVQLGNYFQTASKSKVSGVAVARGVPVDPLLAPERASLRRRRLSLTDIFYLPQFFTPDEKNCFGRNCCPREDLATRTNGPHVDPR